MKITERIESLEERVACLEVKTIRGYIGYSDDKLSSHFPKNRMMVYILKTQHSTETIGDLCKFTVSDVLKVKTIGRMKLNKIMAKLASLGLSLKC